MDLYLIRHAEAVSRNDENYSDDERPLTDHGREQSREQAENDANRADRFQKENHVGGGNGWFDAPSRHAVGGEQCDRTGGQLDDAVNEQHAARREADDKPCEIA